jgi:hypothetical protein
MIHPPFFYTTPDKMKTQTKLNIGQGKWKYGNFPLEPRTFSQNEEKMIQELLHFRTKKLAKASAAANYYVRWTITVIEMNGGLKDGCSLAVHELKSVFGSLKTATNVLKCIEPIVKCNGFWDREKHITKKYWIKDNFRMCQLADALATKKENQHKEEEKNEVELSSQDSISPLFKKRRTSFNLQRYKSIGLDPLVPMQCKQCFENRPLYMFSIRLSDNTPYNKCAICFEEDSKEERVPVNLKPSFKLDRVDDFSDLLDGLDELEESEYYKNTMKRFNNPINHEAAA